MFRTAGDEKVWTRTYTPGVDNWIKADELALKSEISSSQGGITEEQLDQKLSSYVSKTDIVPS